MCSWRSASGGLAGYVALGRALVLESNRLLEVSASRSIRRSAVAGSGRLLVGAAVREASARGARRLTLRVLAPNAAARRLYESCGFEVEGVLREEFWLGGRFVDDVLMALNLSSASRAG